MQSSDHALRASCAVRGLFAPACAALIAGLAAGLAGAAPTDVQFTEASSSLIRVSWTLASSSQTPLVVLSTDNFVSVNSSQTLGVGVSSASFSTLDNTTYYFKVKVSTLPDSDYSTPIATVTSIATPTALVFDDVSTTTIVVSAYAPTPAFSNLDKGLSATNIAKDGAYAGFHSGNRWVTKAAMPTARKAPLAAVVGGKLYAIGGAYGTPDRTRNEAYDPESDSWTARSPLPTGRETHTGGVVAGRVYVIGGYDGPTLAQNEEYDPASDSWTAKAAMPSARHALAGAVADGKVHVVGGYDLVSEQSANQAFDPGSNSWATRAALPAARQYAAAAPAAGGLYVIGGNGGAATLDANLRYDVATNTWTARAPMPTARYALAAASVGGKIYVVGGRTVPSSLDVNEEYDPASNTWTTRASMPTARDAVAVGVLNGRLYAVGGWNGAYLATNEEYDPGVAQRFSGLTPNTLYSFKAKARNSVGVETPESVTVSTHTLAAQPSGSAVLSVTSHSVRAGWSMNGNPAGTEFQAEVSTMPSFNPSSPGAWTADAVAVTISGLTPSTTYYLRARARNGNGIPTPFDVPLATRTEPGPASFSFLWGAQNGSMPCRAAAGDYDNDGLPDVAAAYCGNADFTNRVYRNLGNGSFSLVWSSTQAETTRSVAWGDFNNDGLLDLAFGNDGSGQPNVRVYRNDSGGSFTLVWTSTHTDRSQELQWGDYNNDGRLDLLAVNDDFFSPSKTRIYRNAGDESFSSVWSAPEPNGYSSAAWGDYDRDGRLDIVASVNGSPSKFTRVYRNTGGDFVAVWASTETGIGSSVRWGDLDGDGRLDFVTTDGNKLRYYRYDGSTFTWAASADASLSNRLAVGDFDQDGDLDLATHLTGSGGSGADEAFQNDGVGGFTSLWSSSHGFSGQGSIELSDMTGDGILDLLVAGYDCCSSAPPALRVYKNSTRPNSAPTPPSGGFSASYANQVLTLRWNAAGDLETPASGLRYLVRVGTAPGGQSILSDAVTPTQGSFAQPHWVSATELGRDLSASLAAGTTVYWSVTTIDGGGRRGSMSAEQALFITPLVAAPSSFAGTAISQTAIRWTWLKNSTNEAGFRVMSGTTSVSGDLPAGTTSWNQAGLSTNTAYGPYLAQAFNSSGTAESGSASVSTLANPPTGLAASDVGASSATLTWSANGNPAGTVWDLHRSTNGAAYASIYSASALNVSDTDLSGASTYYYRVQARNGDGVATSFAGPIEVYTLWAATTSASELPAGCAFGFNVKKDGTRDFTAIQTAVDALSRNLTGDACVIIRDAQTYSEQVTIRGFTNNGYQIRIMADPSFVSSGPVISPPAASTAAFLIANASVTLQNLIVSAAAPMPYGLSASSGYVTITGFNVYGGNLIYTAGIAVSSHSAVSNSSITVQVANGLQVAGDSSFVSSASITNNSAAYYALHLNGVSFSTITKVSLLNPSGHCGYLASSNFNEVTLGSTTDCGGGLGLYSGLYLSNSSSNTLSRNLFKSYYGYGLTLAGNSSHNRVLNSTFTMPGAGNQSALEVVGSFFNEVTACKFDINGGPGIHVLASAYNTISQTTITVQGGGEAIAINASSYTSVTQCHLSNDWGYGVGVYNSANHNTISQCRIIGSGSGGHDAGVLLIGSFNTITQSHITNAAAYGLRLAYAGTSNNLVAQSTITSTAAGFSGLYSEGGSSNAITGCYIQGSTAAHIVGSSSITIASSLLAATGGSQAFGLFLGINNPGTIWLSSNVVSGPGVGLAVATQPAGTELAVSSLTFNALSSGATAIRFLGGTLVSTFTTVAFADPGISVNVDGARLGAQSRITMLASTGARTGPSFENDPLGDVDWLDSPTLPAGPAAWTQLSPGASPAARYRHSAVYDRATNRMIVFGGAVAGGCTQGSLNDLWVLANANGQGGAPAWTQLSPTGGPPAPRSAHGAGYDAASDRMIVFGGNGDGCAPAGFNDVWVLSGASGTQGTPAWTQLATAGSPPPGLASSAVVYDAAGNRLLVFGGNLAEGFNCQTSNGVWALSYANGLGGTPTWTQLAPSGGPPAARWHSSAVFDPANDRMTIFGGDSACSGPYNDTWVLTNVSSSPAWTQLSVATAPSPRASYATVYDAVSNRMLIFGGGTTSSYVAETWALDGANGLATPSWTPVSVSTMPESRVKPSAVYDPGSGGVTVFGGAVPATRNDVWLLSSALPVSIPAAPAGFDLYDATVDSILWRWTDNATNELGYRVLLGTQNVSGDLPANTTTWLQTGLSTNSTAGALRAQAFNVAGSSDSSLRTGYSRAVPPFGLAATAIHITSVTLSWQSGSNPPWTTWILDQSTFAPIVGFPHVLVSSGPTTFTVTGLSPGTSYYFEVYANSGNGIATSRSVLWVTTGSSTTARTWVGLGVSQYASEAANWSPAGVPSDGESFVFSGASTRTCYWDRPISIATLTLTTGFDGWAALYFRSSATIAEVHASTGFLALASYGSTVTVTGNIEFTGQLIPIWDRAKIRLLGNLRYDAATSANFTVSPTTATIELAGASVQTIYGTGNPQLPFLEMTSSSDVYISHNNTVQATAIHLKSGRLVLNPQGVLVKEWRHTGGTFVPGRSTVRFWNLTAPNRATVLPLPGSRFWSVEAGFGTNGVAHLEALGPLAVDWDFKIVTGSFSGGGFTHVVGGDWQELGGPSFWPGGGLKLTAGRDAGLRLSPGTALGRLELAPACASCTISALSDSTIGGDFVVTVGTWSPGAFTQKFRGHVVSTGGWILAGTGASIFDGSSAQTLTEAGGGWWGYGRAQFYRLIVANPAGLSRPGSNASHVPVFKLLDIRPASSFDLTGDTLRLEGDLISSGTLTLGGSLFVVAGSGVEQAVQADALAFDQLNVADVSRPTFAGSFSASVLSVGSPSSVLTFQAGSTVTVTQLQTQTGAAAGPWTRWRSTIPGASWHLRVLTTPTVEYVDVQDSDASSGEPILALSTTNVDAGNNRNWVFAGAPAAPTGFAGAAQGASSVLWSWNDAAVNEAGYRVVFEGEPVSGDLPPGTTSWLQTGLGPDALVGPYSAQAFHQGGAAGSSTATARTHAAVPAGIQPPMIRHVIPPWITEVDVRWSTGINPASTGLEVHRSTNGLAGPFAVVGSTTGTLFTDTGDAVSSCRMTSLAYKARGINGDGVPTALSPPVNISYVPAPAAPTGLAAIALSSGSILWSWNDNACDEQGYKVLAGTATVSPVLPADTTTWLQTGLAPNSLQYSFDVMVFGSGGNFRGTNLSRYSLTDAPGSPAAVAASSLTITLSWSANGNPAGTIYQLERSTGGPFAVILSTPGLGTLDAGLAAYTTYQYRVRGINGDGVPGAYSATLVTMSGAMDPPIAPQGFSGVAVGTGSIRWSWTDASLNETGFRVLSGTISLSGDLPAGATSWTQTGLSPNRAYGPYAVRAFHPTNGANSGPAMRYTLPAPASAFSLLAVGSTTIALGWGANGNPSWTLYEVHRTTGGAFSLLNSTTGFSLREEGLAPGTLTSYLLKPMNGDGLYASVLGSTSAVTAAASAPPAPSGLSGSAQGTTGVLWTWTDNAADENGFRVMSGGINVSGNLPPDTTSWLQTRLSTNSAAGPYRVQAFNTGGVSQSAAATAWTLAATPADVFPLSVSSSAITLGWSADGNPAGTSYGVALSTVEGAGALDLGAQPAALTRSFAGLLPGTTYHFLVAAVSSAGVVSAAAPASARTSDLSAPIAPADFFGTALDTDKIRWSWSDLSADETGFRVMSGSSPVSPLLPAGATSWLQAGLWPNAWHGPFYVRAYGAGGTADSGLFQRATLAAAPGGLAAPAVSSTTLRLAWSAGANPFWTRYVIERSTGGGFAFAALLATTTLVQAGLAPSTTYHYRVQALNFQQATTEFTPQLSVTTLPPDGPSAPAGVAGLAVGRGAIRWTWQLGAGEASVRVKQGGTNLSGDLPSRTLVWLQTGLSTNTLAGPIAVEAFNGGGSAVSTAPVSRYTLAAPPVSLTVTSVSSAGALVSWSANANPAGTVYELYRSTGFGYALVASAPAVFRADSGLSPQSTYYYQVRALNGDGLATIFSRAATAVTGRADAPSAPTGFSGNALSVGRVQWFWSDNADNETGYRVLSGATNLSGDLPAGTVAWVQTGLSTNTLAGPLRVQAFNGGGTAASATGFRFTLATAPGALNALLVSSTSLTIGWLENGNPSGTQYEVQRSTGGAFESLVSQMPLLYTDRNVAPGAEYFYRVRAVNGNSIASEFGPLLAVRANDASAPTPPGSFSGRALSTSSIEWSWLDTASNELGYRVVSGTISLSGDLAAAATTWVQTGLQAGVAYGPYAAQAFNAGGGANSGTSSRSTLPAAPAGLAALAVSSVSAALSWTAGGAGVRYELERSQGGSFSTVWTGDAPPATSYGLTPATAYAYRLRSVNADGLASEYGTPLAVETLGPAPVAPAGLAAATGPSAIRWSWSPLAGATGYRLYYATSPSVLAGSAAGTEFTQEGLSLNERHSLALAAVNSTGEGARTGAALAHTRADTPSSLSVTEVHATSASFAWSMGANPAGTRAELEVSDDGATWRRSFLGAAAVYTDYSLLACKPTVARVRALNGDSAATEYSGTVSFTTKTEDPLPPARLSAASLAGNRIAFQWSPSPSEGITAYRLYYDAGSGAIDYVLPLAVFTSTETSWTSGVLVSSPAYRFGLRAVNRCGAEEPNTSVLATAASLNSLTGVRAAIKVPDSGKKVDGNRVTIVAEIILGDDAQTRQVLFQYKASADSSWTDVTAANANHPNPDFSRPWFIHFDVTGLASGSYDLRAVAMDFSGNADATPPAITVTVDPADPDISETSLGGGDVQKEQKIHNGGTSTVRAADEGSTQVSEVTIPPGALDSSTATITVINNPLDVPPVSRRATQALAAGARRPSAADDGVEPANAYVEITLSNGQSLLAAGKTAAISISYVDADDNGIVDGTTLKATDLTIFVYDPVNREWRKDFNSTVDASKRLVAGNTPHFSLFGLFGAPSHAALGNIRIYPVPFKPNGGNPDEGRAYSPSDPSSGIIFENLPAGSVVTVYTVSGRRVKRMTSETGGKLQWDARNEDGRDVATGGYLAVVTSPGQQTAGRVIAIIR